MWIRENIKVITPEDNENRNKILLGINFYGYDFGGTSGVQGKPCDLQWNEPSKLYKTELLWHYRPIATLY